MAETFLGELVQTKLFDILKPLLTEKKSGKITIKGKEEGEIYLDRGDIVHAKTEYFNGENAFFILMSMKSGRVSFEPEALYKEKTIPITTEQLLLNWSSRKQEFEKIREVVPSHKSIFHLSLQKDGKEKNLNADQWNIVALTNGRRTVSEIAKSLQWDEYKTMKVVYQLVQMGLLARADDSSPTKKKLVRGDFFTLLDRELKKVMGPVAPFIIDDKLIEFGESKENFPEERVLPFMESLSKEIPNPQKRSEFLNMTMKLLSF